MESQPLKEELETMTPEEQKARRKAIIKHYAKRVAVELGVTLVVMGAASLITHALSSDSDEEEETTED